MRSGGSFIWYQRILRLVFAACSPLISVHDALSHSKKPDFLKVGSAIAVCVSSLCIYAPLSWGAEGDPKETRAGINFPIGLQEDGGAVARVVVEQVLQPEKKRGILPPMKSPVPVATGIAVRFEKLDAAALDEIPGAVKALAKTATFQMRRLSFFAPGDPVPRLMADEVVVKAPGIWNLKRVLLADRPSVAECRLVWASGPPRLAFAGGRSLELNDLLSTKGWP